MVDSDAGILLSTSRQVHGRGSFLTTGPVRNPPRGGRRAGPTSLRRHASRCGDMRRTAAPLSCVIDDSDAEIGGDARCLDAGSLQRAPKSPPDASWTDPISRFPSVDPATRRPPSHRTVGSKATRPGGPFRRRASRLVGKRDPKAARPAEPFHPRVSRPDRPFRLSAPRPAGPTARRRKPLEPFHRKASRPADPSLSMLPGPMGGGPKATDPPDLSARRLRGRPDPSARGLPDPMKPDPKTEFHGVMVKQNSKRHNKKFHSERIFLWIINHYFHMLSTYSLKVDISSLISCGCRNRRSASIGLPRGRRAPARRGHRGRRGHARRRYRMLTPCAVP